MELTAVGVDDRYIADLARAGYRPRTVQSLVEFRALGITPEWIGGFARIGYDMIPSDDLMQLKALNVTPEFVAGFDRIRLRPAAGRYACRTEGAQYHARVRSQRDGAG